MLKRLLFPGFTIDLGLSLSQAVLEPYNYVISNPGKDIRSQLMAAFNVWLKVPPQKLDIISKVVTMLHNASLL